MQKPIKNSLAPKILFFAAFVYSIALLLLSLWNIQSLPELEMVNADKLFHAIAYFGLVVLWYLYYFFRKISVKLRPRILRVVCLAAFLFGIFIETTQGVATSYRSWDVFDMLANLTGILVAFLCLAALKEKLENLKMKI